MLEPPFQTTWPPSKETLRKKAKAERKKARQKARRHLGDCFWCGCTLLRCGGKETKRFRKTRDHLVSRPLATHLQIKRPNWTVAACYACNNIRGLISALLLNMGMAKRIRSKQAWRERRQGLLPYIEKMRERIMTLPSEQAEVCIKELDIVMAYTEYDV